MLRIMCESPSPAHPPTRPPNPTCSIKAAGGFLIQVLPFAEDETIEALERNITAAGSVTDMLARGMTAADISEQLLAGLGGQDTGFQLTPRWVAEFGAVAGCVVCEVVCEGQRQRQQVAGERPGWQACPGAH